MCVDSNYMLIQIRHAFKHIFELTKIKAKYQQQPVVARKQFPYGKEWKYR